MSHVDAVAAGRARRVATPRSGHAHYEPGERSALALLTEQNATRVPSLVPLRMERMLESAFAFYRGTAGIMAHDLARGTHSGITVVSCGDAHISNFGLFASPLRTLVFDLNDFDEAAIAPWEWDVKRLVTSVVVGGRQLGLSDKKVRAAARHAASAYRKGLASFMKLDIVERYYSHLDTDQLRPTLSVAARAVLDKATAQAKKRTSEAFVEKITVVGDDGRRVLVENPPVLTHLPNAAREEVERIFGQYRRTVPADVSLLLSQMTVQDVAMRVVGVGSVGTRCFILLLSGPRGESLVLQIKEAPPSVVQTYGGIRQPSRQQEGRRVVMNQRVLQAVSDSFLGHVSFAGHDYYVRQFRDMKGSIEVEKLDFDEYVTYVGGCGAVLARAHAQSPRAPEIAGYLGESETFDTAVVDWSFAYAEQSLADYRELLANARR